MALRKFSGILLSIHLERYPGRLTGLKKYLSYTHPTKKCVLKGNKWTLGVFAFLGMFKKEPKTDEDKLIDIMKMSVLNMEHQEFLKAEQQLHLALKIAQDLEHKQAITYIYDLLANNAYESGQWEKAEKLFKIVIQRFISKGIPADDNGVVAISLKLSEIYVHLNELEKAVEGYKFCVETQKRKLKANPSTVDEDTIFLYAMSLDYTSKFLVKQKEYKLAEEYLLDAYKICLEQKGELYGQTAVLLNDLGSLYYLMKQNEKAIDHIERAIHIAETLNLDDLCVFLTNLGVINLLRSKQKAIENCEKAQRLAKKTNNMQCRLEAEQCLLQAQQLHDETKPR